MLKSVDTQNFSLSFPPSFLVLCERKKNFQQYSSSFIWHLVCMYKAKLLVVLNRPEIRRYVPNEFTDTTSSSTTTATC